MARDQELTAEIVREILRYDEVSGNLYWRKRPVSYFCDSKRWTAKEHCKAWNTQFSGKEAGWLFKGRRGQIRRCVTVLKKKYYATHIIWMLKTGALPTGIIDHKDRNSLNDRWSNLRETTQSVNCKNASLRKDNSTGVNGVRRFGNKYQARISVNKRYIHLGTFLTLDEATKARAKANKQYSFSKNHGMKKETSLGTS
jgi:hypothetical protein